LAVAQLRITNYQRANDYPISELQYNADRHGWHAAVYLVGSIFNLIASDTFTASPTTNLTFHIGEDYNNGGYGWMGPLDEVRLYCRTLTAAEVGRHIQSMTTGYSTGAN
jgi:hypothetical protein